jgi:hypothetical protein
MKGTSMRPRNRWPILLALVLPLSAPAQVAVLGDLVHEKTASAGLTYEGVITVQNVGGDTREVRVYQNDYRYDAEGVKSYTEPGTAPRSNAKWINFTPRQFAIGPGEKSEIHYLVKVPADSSLQGTYWSMMLVEPVVEINPESLKEGQIQFTERVRYGIHMITNIGSSGVKKLAFPNIRLIKTDTTRFLQIDIANTGDRRLYITLWTDLFDMQGRHVGKYSAEDDACYPGSSIRCKIDLAAVPPGTYKALIVADGGEEALFGVDYTIKLE